MAVLKSNTPGSKKRQELIFWRVRCQFDEQRQSVFAFVEFKTEGIREASPTDTICLHFAMGDMFRLVHREVSRNLILNGCLDDSCDCDAITNKMTLVYAARVAAANRDYYRNRLDAEHVFNTVDFNTGIRRRLLLTVVEFDAFLAFLRTQKDWNEAVRRINSIRKSESKTWPSSK